MPSHISSHCSQFAYINIPDKIMGGVIIFKNEHYEKVNGFSNDYIGWGKEDDDLYLRCEKENLFPYKHALGRFYSVPHPLRLKDENEKLMHVKNGEKFNDFLNGNKDYKQEGLNKIYLNDFSIEVTQNQLYQHCKIKSK
jgi:hypothetical protein